MFQNKKIIISSLLFLLIAVGFAVPQKANASMFGNVAGGFIAVPVAVTAVIAETAYSCMTWIVSGTAIDVAYTPHPSGWGKNNPIVDAGWGICRSLANMLIVLGFVVVGIATILRLQEYQAQKLLPKLILIAILVNFSPIICGLVIDASNITTNFFLKGVPASSLMSVNEQINSIIDPGIFKRVMTGFSLGGLIGATIAAATAGGQTIVQTLIIGGGYLLTNIVGIFTYGLLFFLFIARYVMLWILVIFSPIAFVCYVFPFTNQYFKQWWDQFLKWCIMGIPAAFTLYLAARANELHSTGITGDAMVTFFLPAMIMLVGFFYSLKFSGAGAALAIGAAAAVGGAALGAIKVGAKGTAGVLGKLTGAGAAKDWVGQKFGAGLEAIGARPAGQTALQGAEKRKNALARAQADYAKNPDKMVKDAGSAGMRREDREARAIVAAQEGKADLYNPQFLSNYKSAINRGYDVKEAEQKNPQLARFNERKVSNLMKTQSLNRSQAEEQAVIDTTRKLDPRAYAQLPAEAMSPTVLGATSLKQLQTTGGRGSPKLIDKLKNFAKPGSDEHNELKKHIKTLAKGSSERNNIATLIREIKTNSDFS